MLNYKDDLLMHDGTKGMRWGIRKYRNYDGTLTPAGRERYGVGPEREGSGSASKVKPSRAERRAAKQVAKKASLRTAKKEAKSAAEEARKAAEELRQEREALQKARDEATVKQKAQERNDIIRLDNQELAARIERMKLEREYSALVNPPPAKRQSLLSKLSNVSKDLKGIIEMGSSVAKLYTDASKAMEQSEKRKKAKSGSDSGSGDKS